MNKMILFSDLLFIGALGALIITYLYNQDRKRKTYEDWMFLIFSFSSMLWSLGFALLLLQTEPFWAHLWRCIAIFGTISYIISSQVLLCSISNMKKKQRYIFEGIAMCGIPVYLITMISESTIYKVTDFGMSYSFVPGAVSIMYSLYFTVATADLFVAIIRMIRKSESKQIRSFGLKFLLVGFLVVLGTALDLVLPAVGLPAVPGSCITQFWGLLIVNSAMISLNKSYVNIINMSEYIYYSLKDPILIFNDKDELMVANSSAVDFFDAEDENELLGKRLQDLFLIEDDLFADGTYASFDITCAINYRPCNLSVSRIHDKYGDSIGYIAIAKDRSERVKYIEELKHAREEADASNNAKSTFLANMSHEIRTPMNAIIGFSDIILKQDLSKEEILDYVENVRESSYGLLNIINDILDFSKIESGKMDVVNGNYETETLFKNIVNQMKPMADAKGLGFELELDSKLPSVMNGDETKIREILINLLSNAIKYTKEGHVALKIERLKEANSGRALLEMVVSDTGCGISKEDQKDIFEAFEQVNKRLHAGIEGTGLGLSIVKGYVTLMGGDVRIDSDLGKGSSFIVTLEQEIVDDKPVGVNERKEPAKRVSKIGELSFEGMTVLAVDDNKVNLKVISKILELYGFKVDVANSGKEAIELCRSVEYPIVFMDQMMPEMDGVEAMHLIRNISDYYAETVKVVALTANAVSEARDELMNEGFDEYLKKPIEYDRLEEVLKEFTQGWIA